MLSDLDLLGIKIDVHAEPLEASDIDDLIGLVAGNYHPQEDLGNITALLNHMFGEILFQPLYHIEQEAGTYHVEEYLGINIKKIIGYREYPSPAKLLQKNKILAQDIDAAMFAFNEAFRRIYPKTRKKYEELFEEMPNYTFRFFDNSGFNPDDPITLALPNEDYVLARLRSWKYDLKTGVIFEMDFHRI